MIKRFLFIVIGLLMLTVSAYADTATKARVASTSASGIESVVAVADASSGDTVEIDSAGALRVSEYAETCSDVQTADALILTGAGRIKSITANTTQAEDYLLIYDATSATGTPKVDIRLDVANEQYTVPLNFDIGTGIYVDYSGTNGNVAFSVTYNSD